MNSFDLRALGHFQGRKMKHLIFLGATFLLFFGQSFEIYAKKKTKEKVLKLATIEWPPYVSGELDGKGWTSEVIKSAFKSQGLKIRFAVIKGNNAWGRVLKGVKKGTFVGGYPAYYSEDRAQHYFFSRPLGKGPLVFFKRKGEKVSYDGDLETLKKYKIGIVKDYYNGATFSKANYLTKKIFKSDRVSLVMLSKKRVDLVLLDKLVTEFHLKNDPYLKKLKLGIQAVEPPLENKALHVAFSKKHKNGGKYLRVFNKGLNAIRENGELEKILIKNKVK